jgi:hypothetical protein
MISISCVTRHPEVFQCRQSRGNRQTTEARQHPNHRRRPKALCYINDNVTGRDIESPATNLELDLKTRREQEPRVTELDRIFTDYAGEHTPGAALRIIRDGEPELTRTWGMADVKACR